MNKRKRASFCWVNNYVLDSRLIGSSEKIVYLALSRYADNETQECYPSNLLLEDVTGLTNRTISSSIKELEENNFIEVVRNPGKVNHYFLLDNPTPEENSTAQIAHGVDTKWHEVSPQNSTTNKTYIKRLKKKTKYTPKLVPLEGCSIRVKYAVETLGLQPTAKLVDIIDNEFKEYNVRVVIDNILLWCGDKGIDPNNASMFSKWLHRELDRGTLPKRKLS